MSSRTSKGSSVKCSRCGHGRKSSRGCGSGFHEGRRTVSGSVRSGRSGTGEVEHPLALRTVPRYREPEQLDHGVGYVEPQRRRTSLKTDLARYERDIGMGSIMLSSVEETIVTISELPRVTRKRNLFYIVLPSGVGKTYLSGKYGFLDIDSCMGSYDKTYLSSALEMCYSGSESNKARAKEWLLCVREVFRGMVFTKPTFVLVHDEQTGYITGGMKVGEANLPLSLKLRMNRSMDRKREALITINDSIYNSFTDGGRMFETHEEVEQYVLMRASKMGIDHAGASCQSSIGMERAEEMGHQDLVQAFRAGQVTKEYVDIRANEDRDITTSGFGTSLNTWAMAMAGSFYGSSKKSDSFIVRELSNFSEGVDVDVHPDLRKINRLNIDDEDKLVRLSWWSAYGKTCEAAPTFLEVLAGVGPNAEHVFTSMGLLLAKSRFLFDLELSDEDRVAFLGLCRMYGFRGQVELYEQKGMDALDAEDRIFRHARSKTNVFLTEDQSAAVGALARKEVVPRKMTSSEACTALGNWQVKQVAALYQVFRDNNTLSGLGDGANKERALVMLVSQLTERIECSSLDWRFRDMLDCQAGSYPGIGPVVSELGLENFLEIGKFSRMEVGETVIEGVLSGGRNTAAYNTEEWKVANIVGSE